MHRAQDAIPYINILQKMVEILSSEWNSSNNCYTLVQGVESFFLFLSREEIKEREITSMINNNLSNLIVRNKDFPTTYELLHLLNSIS